MSAALTGQPRPGIPSAIIGIVLVLMAETMLFAGLIGACVMLRSRAPGAWPPADLPRLPWMVTVGNLLLLLATAVLLTSAVARRSRGLTVTAACLGLLFLGVQSIEWIRMLGWRGSDAAYTGIFDALVGTHALHVFGGAVALLWAGLTTRRSNDETLRLQVTATYWYFVVGVWPVLYGLVYH